VDKGEVKGKEAVPGGIAFFPSNKTYNMGFQRAPLSMMAV
jgi:hypothetical protein